MAVKLEAELLKILACPSSDHAPLRVGAPGEPEADALTCTSCGRVFPVREGIPVLLLDEAFLPGEILSEVSDNLVSDDLVSQQQPSQQQSSKQQPSKQQPSNKSEETASHGESV